MRQRTESDIMSKSKNKAKDLTKPQSKKRPKLGLKKNTETDPSVIKKALAFLGVLCVISTIVFDKTREMGGAVFPILSLTALVGLVVFLYFDKKLTVQNAALIIMAAGFILRLNYVIYTPLSETVRLRQHDLFEFGGTKGHSAYIEHFYNNGFTLPDFDPTSRLQFYHPPLHHLLAAMWMRLLTTFGMSYTRAVGSLMFLSLFYSNCCIIVCERIFSKLRLSGAAKLIALSIVTFHPTFILLSGSVNNDILSILFILLSVYFTLVWYEDPTTRNIINIAFAIGLGMSTKLSAALVSVPIAGVFLTKLIVEKKKVFENVVRYCIFGVICIPLGLWFPIRNAIKYDVPFTYVHKLSETSDQYIGDKSVYERLFDFSYYPFANVFLNRESTGADYFEYNPLVAIIKTSMTGEYNYAPVNDHITFFCRILQILNIILIVLSVLSMVYFLIKKSDHADITEKVFLVFFQLLLFVYFIKFCFDFPHNCSMDFRYIVPTCVLGSYFIGAALEQFTDSKKNKRTLVKAVKAAEIGLTSCFCLTSAIVYIMLGA